MQSRWQIAPFDSSYSTFYYSAIVSVALLPFLLRVSTLTRDIDIAILSVCLSVCPSVHLSVRDVPVLDENGLTYCHSVFHRTVAQSL